MSSKKKDSNEKPEFIKIVLLGNGGVGKTTLIYKYTNKIFIENTIQTSSAENISKSININGKKYVLDIWDTAG